MQHQFKPGQSGNPKGRPKGALGVSTIVRKLLETKVAVRSDGRTRRISRIEALLLKSVEMAGKGDARATDRLLRYYAAAVPDVVPALAAAEEQEAELSLVDEAILAAFRAEVLEEERQREGGSR